MLDGPPLLLALALGAAPAPQADAPFTTIIKWNPYNSVAYDGAVYGMKDVEFLKFQHLPARTEEPLELATEGEGPLSNEELAHLGWRIRDAWGVTSSMTRYREYIHRSRGEWSLAKNCYVASRSGWFSDGYRGVRA